MDIQTRCGKVSDAQKLWRGGQESVAGRAEHCEVSRKLLFFVAANRLLGHQIKLIDDRSRANTQGSSMAGGRRTAELAAR